MRSILMAAMLVAMTLAFAPAQAHDCAQEYAGVGYGCYQEYEDGYEDCTAAYHGPLDAQVHLDCHFTPNYNWPSSSCTYAVGVGAPSNVAHDCHFEP